MNKDCSVGGISCLVCGGAAIVRREFPPRWQQVQCGTCRLEFCHPIPGEKELGVFYARYKDPRAAADIVAVNAERNRTELSTYGLRADMELLDYGSGQGIFCRQGSGHWRNYDPYTRDNHEAVLQAGHYDWVTLWGVLEHLPDPRAVLQTLRTLLKEGGSLALTTVSTETSIPYQFKPPEHLTYWNRRSLEEVFLRTGFSLCECRPYVMVQHSDVYLQAVLRTVPEHLKGYIHHELPDRVEVPTNEVFVVARCQARNP